MGIRLVVEVLDHAPADLTPAEVLVLVAIAECARDATRLADPGPGMAKLARRARLTAMGVRHALLRLAARGLEARVPLGLGRDGRPYFSQHGLRTVYRVPVFHAAERRSAENASRGPSANAIETERRSPANPSLSVEAFAGERPSPQNPPQTQSPQREKTRWVEIVMTAVPAASEVEAAAVVEAVRREHRPASLAGYLTAMAREGDLAAWVAREREAAAARERAAAGERRRAWLAGLDALPVCEHGVAGGHVPDGAGWARCAVWRARQASV